MKPQATRETLERLAEAIDRWIQQKGPIEIQPGWAEDTNNFYAALTFYRAELTPPLRTRAEVDAEIATVIRDYHRHITRPGWKERCDWDSFSVSIKDDLNRLCAEPTREPEAETGRGHISDRQCRHCGSLWATPVERLSHEGACHAADHPVPAEEPDLPDPPCSCDQALALQKRIDRALEIFNDGRSQCGGMWEMARAMRGDPP